VEERFPEEISEHYDREIDEAQRITQGLRAHLLAVAHPRDRTR
jgi:hypothetical protein